jgi:hypothetical protein
MSEEKPQESAIILREREGLNVWRRGEEAPLPLARALQLYTLYLNGYSCDEIYRINGGRIPFGQIVDAKERYQWDERKKTQIDSVYSNIEEKIIRTKNDAILHITDRLAAAHKIMGDKLRLFLQDGDSSTLEGLDVEDLKTYKDLLNLLVTLTNTKDSKKDVRVDGTVNHVHVVGSQPKKMSGQEASNMLSLIEGEVKDG